MNTEAFNYDYQGKWNWGVEIDGYTRAFFTTIDRPKINTEIMEVNPGGTHRPVKLPGRMTFDDLTAERGVLIKNDPDFVKWLNDIQEFQNGDSSLSYDQLLKTIDIVEYDHQSQEVCRWRLFGAWPSAIDGNDLDGSASEVVTESMTITYQYFIKNP